MIVLVLVLVVVVGNLMKVTCVQECLRSRQRSCEEEAGPGETKEESLGGRELVTEEVA